MGYFSHCVRGELVHVNDVLFDARLVVVLIELAPVEQNHARAPGFRKQRLDHAATDLSRSSQHGGCEVSHVFLFFLQDTRLDSGLGLECGLCLLGFLPSLSLRPGLCTGSKISQHTPRYHNANRHV